MSQARYQRGPFPGRPLVRGEIHTPDRSVHLPFQYNPGTIQTNRGVDWKPMGSPGIFAPELWFSSGQPLEVSFTLFFDGRESGFEGGGVQQLLDKVAAFTQPDPNIPLDTLQFNAPPACIFRMGEIVHECVMTKADETVTMFNREGIPVRAKVAISLTRNFPNKYIDVERERHVRLAWNGSPSSGAPPQVAPASVNLLQGGGIIGPEF